MNDVIESGILEKPQNLKEYRAQLRYLYTTNPMVQGFIDFLVSISEVPQDMEDQFDAGAREQILHDYWLYGYVVVDTESPIIYDPGNIKVVAKPLESGVMIYHCGDDITEHAKMIARRAGEYDLLGRSALECLAGAKESFKTSFGSAGSFPHKKK